jgi:hypothetical protein
VKKDIKMVLFQECMRFVEKRINNTTIALNEVQESFDSETKSTAGDKHDTALAMMQLEAEQISKQLSEATKLKQSLLPIDPFESHSASRLGSLVIASNGNFYIAISAGKIEIEGAVFFAVSPFSPMGQVLMDKKAGDSAKFNDLKITIKEIL